MNTVLVVEDSANLSMLEERLEVEDVEINWKRLGLRKGGEKYGG